MKFSEVIGILKETGLSPEKLADYLCVSNMTYRRWLRRDGRLEVPREHRRNVAGGIYRLLGEGRLDQDSKKVSQFLGQYLPECFGAATGCLGFTVENAESHATHQEKVFQLLGHIGANRVVQHDINNARKKIDAFAKMGEEWKRRIRGLLGVLKATNISMVEKYVAYGALFYLITPFDLVPDGMPVAGLVDDFGILGFALTYYAKLYPHLVSARGAPPA